MKSYAEPNTDSWHNLAARNPRHRLRRQLADVDYRFEVGIHGFTQGKLYEPRADCVDCMNEIIERVRFAGVRVFHTRGIIAGIAGCEVGGDRYIFFTS